MSKIEALVEQRSGEDAPSALVIDMSGVLYMDFTALLELERVLGFVEGKLPHTRISISNVGSKIMKVVEKTEMHKYVSRDSQVNGGYGSISA